MTPDAELTQLAEEIASARQKFPAPDVADQLRNLRKAAREMSCAWCGSNLGYHSRVYTCNFSSPAPNAQFNPEWGLMQIATRKPNPIWKLYSIAELEKELLTRSNEAAVEVLKAGIRKWRFEFGSFRESVISILSASSDPYIERRRVEAEGLAVSGFSDAINAQLPTREVFTRDSQAVSEGITAAPHQVALSIPLAADSLMNALDRLERICHETARHFQRSPGSRNAPQTGDRVFVGHGRSLLWRELALFLEKRLGLNSVEFNHVSAAGVGTQERLGEMLNLSGFAFLIMTGEDERADGAAIARANVIHEVGLFQGRLGFRKAIVLLEEGCEEFSNIHGLGHISFPKGRIGAAFEEVRLVLEREGIISAPAA